MADESKEVYPFSTRDGTPIPLDIIKSKVLFYKAFTELSTVYITLPVDTKVAFVYATVDCIIQPSSSPITVTDGVAITEGLFIPRSALLTVSLEAGSLAIKGLAASGFLIVQIVEQWAGLGLEKNYSKR